MKKLRYSTGMKAAAVIAQQILFVVLVISILMLDTLFQKNILNFGDMKNKSFVTSGYFTSMFQQSANEIMNFVDLRKKFETDGSYSDEKVVDIWRYYTDQEIPGEISGKDPGKVSNGYYLGDLVEWSRGYTLSDYNFSSAYYTENGIYQKLTVTKNGEKLLNEEKQINRLEDMSLQLQKTIVSHVEHYYGGSYQVQSGESVSGGAAEADGAAQEEAETGEGAAQEEAETGEGAAQEAAETGEGAAQEEAETGDGAEAQERLADIVHRVITGGLYDLSIEELQILLADMGLEYGAGSETFQFVDEDYLPVGGTGIWENFLKGNISSGQMENEYAALEYTLKNIGGQVNQYKKCLNRYNLEKEESNIYYWIKRGKEGASYTNMTEEAAQNLIEFGKKAGKYFFYREEDMRLETNVKGMEDVFYNEIEPLYGGKDNVLFVCVNTAFPSQDSFYEAKQEYSRMYPWIYIGLVSAAISGLGCLILFIYLSIVAGKTGEEEEIRLNWFDRIPTELTFLGAAFLVITIVMVVAEMMYRFQSGELAGLLIMAGVMAFLSMAFLMLLYLSFVRRIRAGVLWSGSISCWMISGIGAVFHVRRPTTKMLVWFGIHLAACILLLLLGMQSMQGIAAFLLLSAFEGVLIIREGVQRGKVLEGIRRISEGDLEFKIDASDLKGDNKLLAESVNAIGDGLFHAVDASMKNERLKADLITNVSHDIKTPLTSIINYVDLMKREDIPNPRVQNYLEVLEQKSQRLKQLTEDLVEASKVSSGNITLEMERINFVELVYQTGGEFNEKFEAKGLTIITKMPKEPVVILADGRRIWRVIENLYNNVAKYAMANTRVYVDMEAKEDRVWFSIKNISENALNIQADELTERFIRGDVSRSTEGSGLGLSIAKNLTGLMGGEFEIYLDGDLFKATISFRREKNQVLKPEEK